MSPGHQTSHGSGRALGGVITCPLDLGRTGTGLTNGAQLGRHAPLHRAPRSKYRSIARSLYGSMATLAQATALAASRTSGESSVSLRSTMESIKGSKLSGPNAPRAHVL